jgi:hypothetical protein
MELKAQFCVEGEKRDWEGSVIINVSREGLGVTFQTHKKIKVGSTIYLKIFMSAASEPVNAKGVLKWIREEGDVFIGGIELHVISRNSIEIV